MLRFTDSQLQVCANVLWGKSSKLTRKEMTVCHWVMTYLLERGVPTTEIESEESIALNLQYELNKDLAGREYDDFIVGCVCGREYYRNLSYGVPVHVDILQVSPDSPQVEFSIICDTEPYRTEKKPSEKQNLIDGRKQIIGALLLGLRNIESELDKFLVDFVYNHIWEVNEEGRNTPSTPAEFVSVWTKYLQGSIDGDPYEDYVLSLLSDIDAVQLVGLDDVRKYVVVKPYEKGFQYCGAILTSLHDMQLPYDKEEDFSYKNIKVKKAGES